jgi:hypothetical protein
MESKIHFRIDCKFENDQVEWFEGYSDFIPTEEGARDRVRRWSTIHAHQTYRIVKVTCAEEVLP